MPQPPNLEAVSHALDYAERTYGPELSCKLAQDLAADWEAAAEEGPDRQAVFAAGWQLVRAQTWRNAGHLAMAQLHTNLALACIEGWRQELEIATAQVPDTP